MIRNGFHPDFHPLLKNISITEKPENVYIVATLSSTASASYAKEVLDKLMRQAISFSDDSGSPSKEIGMTDYHYVHECFHISSTQELIEPSSRT